MWWEGCGRGKGVWREGCVCGGRDAVWVRRVSRVEQSR